MAAFTELDWSRIDVLAIVAFGGIATIDERRRSKCLDWLQRHGYEVESLDCGPGLAQAIPELGRMLRWRQQFGYDLGAENRNLDALRDGFEFEVPEDGGKEFEIVRADVAWQEDPRWLIGLLAIAQEASRRKLAIGKRFFTLLVVPEDSPLTEQPIHTSAVPVPLLSATSYLNFRRISAGHAYWAVADNWRRLLRRSFAGQVSRSRGRPHKKLLRPELLT